MHELVVASNVIWALISMYCIKNYHDFAGEDFMKFIYVTLTLNGLNSLLGLSELYSEEALYSMRNLLDLLLLVLSLPCLTTEIWLKYNIANREVAWLHTLLGLMPTYIFIFQHYTRQDLVDLAVVLNELSLIGVGMKMRNYYAICAGCSFFTAYSIFDQRLEFAFDLPSKHFFNCCMAMFTFCAYKAVILEQ